MTNEELILDKLARIEGELMEMRQSRLAIQELKDDLNPLVKQGFYILLRELGEVESGFQLEDSIVLIKRFLRNIKNMAFALEQLENAIDLWTTIEPLMKSGVHAVIRELGALEAKGVFRTYAAMLELRGKVAQHYGPEDIEAMGDGFVEMLGLMKKLATPECLALLNKLADLPAAINLDEAKPVGVKTLFQAARDPALREGMGVALELAKALRALK